MIIYRSKMSHGGNKKNFQAFSSMEFIASITQHLPERLAQIVRYYGWYSNRMRGDRNMRKHILGTPTLLHPSRGIAPTIPAFIQKLFPHPQDKSSPKLYPVPSRQTNYRLVNSEFSFLLHFRAERVLFQ